MVFTYQKITNDLKIYEKGKPPVMKENSTVDIKNLKFSRIYSQVHNIDAHQSGLIKDRFVNIVTKSPVTPSPVKKDLSISPQKINQFFKPLVETKTLNKTSFIS